MKRYKIQHVIKKQGGNYQVVFNDGTSVFWPREYMNGLTSGTRICEHKHKNGQTVAFSWSDKLRFVVKQPLHFDDSLDFIEQFDAFDRISFNNAVVRALGYKIGLVFSSNIVVAAHNMVLLGIKSGQSKTR